MTLVLLREGSAARLGNIGGSNMSDMDPYAKEKMVRTEVARLGYEKKLINRADLLSIADQLSNQATGQIEPEHSMMLRAAKLIYETIQRGT